MIKLSFQILIISTFILFVSCDEKYSYDQYSPEYNPLNSTFFTGDTSENYINYEPNISISLKYNTDDSMHIYTILDSLDLDQDNTFDFTIIRLNNKELTDIPENIAAIQFNLDYLQQYSTVAYNANSGSSSEAFNYGTILYDLLNWQKIYGVYLFYSEVEPNGSSLNSETGFKWDEEKYFAFRKFSKEESILGWLRMEFCSETFSLIIKDCGYKKLNNVEKYYPYYY